jgi:phytol kinase
METFTNLILQTLFTGLYFIGVALIVLFIKYVIKLKGEWYRKILHLFFMGSIFFFTYIFDYWWTSLISLALFMSVALVGLTIIEKYSFYPELLAERKPGEIKRSISIAFIVFMTIIGVVWGILGKEYKYIIIASVLAWGIGDALAALVGKREKTKVITNKLVKSTKTIEGSVAMFVSSAIVIFLVIYFMGNNPIWYSIIISLVAGVVATLTEMWTKEGWDTLSVPIAVMIILTVWVSTFMT